MWSQVVGASVPRDSMLEMKLNTRATIDAIGLDSVNVISYQKTCQPRDRSLIAQQVCVRRPFGGKLHRLPIVAHIDVEIELIKADLSVDLAGAQFQCPCRFDKFVHRRLGVVDHFPACTPDSSLLLHK